MSSFFDFITERIKSRAVDRGAGLAGIAPVDAPVEKDYFRKWLDAGRQGTMSYLSRDPHVRTELRNWYPEARSVLVCAFPYLTEAEPPATKDAGPTGRLARYALLPDYHPVLKGWMGNLLEWIRTEVPGADGRIFVDTSPVLEKMFARYAGVGWMGKNTMLIHPKLGSYFFLAGLALNIDLPADEPTAEEVEILLDVAAPRSGESARSEEERWGDVAHVLFNLGEFLFVR